MPGVRLWAKIRRRAGLKFGATGRRCAVCHARARLVRSSLDGFLPAHGIRFKPNARASSNARALSQPDSAANSGCRPACQAGQNAGRKLTLTPGNSAPATPLPAASNIPHGPASASGARSVRCAAGPEQILPHKARNPGLPPDVSAGVVAELIIRQPDVEHSVQQPPRPAEPCALVFQTSLAVSGMRRRIPARPADEWSARRPGP